MKSFITSWANCTLKSRPPTNDDYSNQLGCAERQNFIDSIGSLERCAGRQISIMTHFSRSFLRCCSCYPTDSLNLLLSSGAQLTCIERSSSREKDGAAKLSEYRDCSACHQLNVSERITIEQKIWCRPLLADVNSG